MTQTPVPINGETPTPESFECIGCGYNLEHTDPLGQCPECGKAVSESKDRDSVRRADRGWVLGMVQGLRWLAYFYIGYVTVLVLGLCGGVVAGIALVVMTVKSGGGGGSGGGPPPLPDLTGLKYLIVAWTGVAYGIQLLFLAILWRLTAPEPGRELTPRPVERQRRMGRIALPIIALLMTVYLPFSIYTLLTQSYNPQSPPALTFWSVVGLVFGFAFFGVMMRLVSVIPADFASRVGSQKLDKQAKRVVIYAMVCFGTSVVATPLSLIGPLSGNNPIAQGVGGCASMPFMLVAFVAGVLMVVEGVLNAFGVAKAAEQHMELAK